MKYKSITLINPPSKWMISDRVYVPFGLLSLAAYLIQNNIRVEFIDLSGGVWKTDWTIPDTDLYGISMVTPQYSYCLEILDKVKKTYPDRPILAGGVHATSLPQSVIEAGFDCVVCGEAEESLMGIMRNGIEKPIYKYMSIKDINKLPFPAYDLVDVESYISNTDVMTFMNNPEVAQQREINIMSTRGCNGHCAYCTSFKGRCRWHTIDFVMDEIHMLQEKYNATRIYFVDDNIVIDHGWLKDLCKRLKEDKIYWHCLGRTDQLTQEICDIMADSGCMSICFGIESGSQKILDILKKNITIKQQETGIRFAYNSGMKTRAQLMVGLPQEAEEDFNLTMDFIKRNQKYVTKYGIHAFVPYPCCDIWRRPEKYQYKVDKDTDFSTFQTIGKPKNWTFKSIESAADHKRWRETILNLIGDADIASIKI